MANLSQYIITVEFKHAELYIYTYTNLIVQFVMQLLFSQNEYR